jgi:hypothetical protein
MPPASSSIGEQMSLWLLIALFGLLKFAMAITMLVVALRSDTAMQAQAESGQSDEDGGSRTPPRAPRDPRPGWPVSRRPRGPHGGALSSTARGRRRGPHGPAERPAPRRVRSPSRRLPAVPTSR